MQCPQCQAKNTKKLSMVYATGTRRSQSVSSSRSRSVSSRLTARVGGSTSQYQGVSQTALAQAASPPQPSRLPKIVAFFLAFMFVLPAFTMVFSREDVSIWLRIFAFILFVGFSVGTYFAYKFLNRGYEQQLDEWERAWICMRCGCVYDPNDDTEQSE